MDTFYYIFFFYIVKMQYCGGEPFLNRIAKRGCLPNRPLNGASLRRRRMRAREENHCRVLRLSKRQSSSWQTWKSSTSLSRAASRDRAFSHDEQGRLMMDRSQLATASYTTRRPSARAPTWTVYEVACRTRRPSRARARECLDSRPCARTASCFKPRAALKTPDKNVERRRAEAAQTEGKKDATPTSGSESLRYIIMSKGLSLVPVVLHFVMIAGDDGHCSPLTLLFVMSVHYLASLYLVSWAIRIFHMQKHVGNGQAPGTVSATTAFCSVVRTRLSSHSVVMAGEVDCCDHMSGRGQSNRVGWVWPGCGQQLHQSNFAFLSPRQRIYNTAIWRATLQSRCWGKPCH